MARMLLVAVALLLVGCSGMFGDSGSGQSAPVLRLARAARANGQLVTAIAL